LAWISGCACGFDTLAIFLFVLKNGATYVCCGCGCALWWRWMVVVIGSFPTFLEFRFLLYLLYIDDVRFAFEYLSTF
jgi:hypothetical protein